MSRFEELSVGDVVVGEVSGVVPFGTFVRFADDADGLLHGKTGLQAGMAVTVRILDKDNERKRASLELA
jgi:predicted RNA-binding protein with RPS1 domain